MQQDTRNKSNKRDKTHSRSNRTNDGPRVIKSPANTGSPACYAGRRANLSLSHIHVIKLSLHSHNFTLSHERIRGPGFKVNIKSLSIFCSLVRCWRLLIPLSDWLSVCLPPSLMQSHRRDAHTYTCHYAPRDVRDATISRCKRQGKG